eukprot:2683736-Karenia_brevis.AAC.1
MPMYEKIVELRKARIAGASSSSASSSSSATASVTSEVSRAPSAQRLAMHVDTAQGATSER